MIDLTITVGNMLEVGTLLVGGLITFVALRASVNQLESEVNEMKDDIKALNVIVTKMAVADQRLLAIENDIREIRHGRGFVHEAIEGEWPKNIRRE